MTASSQRQNSASGSGSNSKRLKEPKKIEKCEMGKIINTYEKAYFSSNTNRKIKIIKKDSRSKIEIPKYM